MFKVWLYAAASVLRGAWISPLFYNAGKALAEVSQFKQINGPLECDKPTDPEALRKNQRRIDFYKSASELFGVPLVHPLGC